MTPVLAAVCQPAHLGDWRNLIAVIWDFLSLSLFSVGGGNPLLADNHYMAVDRSCWLSSQQSPEIYALPEGEPAPAR